MPLSDTTADTDPSSLACAVTTPRWNLGLLAEPGCCLEHPDSLRTARTTFRRQPQDPEAASCT
ncbi:hypothetical protein COCSADRAFT_160226 [Bipolaris sorokiniana ND90Pr]|uniref:Uncharacterized protein n=1 Tax=Cochliobolus sativus (strain ND90Pr / ATCC 201652) TaxID=665912 RepID=M2SSJ5_COCSN|nr:uncharacterized protein COCSADRAFT_160226 [Bipolaris sorokiniana ND90Pr]EMD65260.1 hypothetical protein COCSADRAFT_160226 [Bipolaris sorokiniana ND90Pr]